MKKLISICVLIFFTAFLKSQIKEYHLLFDEHDTLTCSYKTYFLKDIRTKFYKKKLGENEIVFHYCKTLFKANKIPTLKVNSTEKIKFSSISEVKQNSLGTLLNAIIFIYEKNACGGYDVYTAKWIRKY